MLSLDDLRKFLGPDQARFELVRGRFHSHATVRLERAGQLDELRAFCRARQVKLTVIELSNFAEQRQRDVMTTQYYKNDQPGAVSVIVEQLFELGQELESAGFPVLRLKLEHESLPTVESFDDRCYREIHIKLELERGNAVKQLIGLRRLGSELGFVPSRNPYEQKKHSITQFLNMRLYSGDLASTDARVDGVLSQLEARGFKILEVKRETTILDSNQPLDSWWL